METSSRRRTLPIPAFISMFPENVIHYLEYCVLFPSYKRDVFIIYMCTKYIVQFCLLLSFIKITCTYIHTYIHDSGNCISVNIMFLVLPHVQ